MRAVLAYLILAEGRPTPRQELMAFAWSDRAVEQARASLRQALHDARRLSGAGPPLLIADRYTVRIDPNRIDTDLGRILTLARADRVAELAQALDPSPGVLLADLDGVDANIDRWLADARRRWTEQLHAEISACLARAAAAGSAADLGPLRAILAQPGPPSQTAAAPPHAIIGRWRWPILAGVAAAVAAVALLTGLALRAPRNDDILLVEPLQASASDPAAQLVRAGLSGDLAQVMVGRPAGLNVAQPGNPHPNSGRAQLVLAGTAATTGDALRVHLQLADSRTHAILWSSAHPARRARDRADDLNDRPDWEAAVRAATGATDQELDSRAMTEAEIIEIHGLSENPPAAAAR